MTTKIFGVDLYNHISVQTEININLDKIIQLSFEQL